MTVENANDQPQDERAGRRVALRLTLLVALVGAAALGWLALQAYGDPAQGPTSDLQPTLVALSTELAQARAQPAASQATGPAEVPATQSIPTGASDAGGLLVYAHGQPGRSYLEARPVPGGEAVRLTEGHDDLDPALSPDGSEVAFRSRRGGQWDLYLLQLASGEIRRLTDTPFYEGRPTWSPDGRWLAYEAYQDGDLDIWILPLARDGAPIQLTNHPGLDASPSWEPGAGRRIAFISDREGSRDLFLADLDQPANRYRNLTQTPALAERSPAFSPDGAQLAYATHERGLDLLWTLASADPGATPIQRGPGTRPAWSPDGSALLATLRGPHEERLVFYSLENRAPPGVALSSRGLPLTAGWGPAPAAITAAEPVEAGAPARDLSATAAPQQVGRLSLVSFDDLEAPNPSLAAAAEAPFSALRARSADLVGWDFLAELDYAFVGLNDPLPPGFAYNDWLYTGRAFAFPQQAYRHDWVEVAREDFGGQTYWRVFVRAAAQDGSLGEPLRQRPWDFDARYRGDPSDYDQGGRPLESIPDGYYVDFTALAEAHGFERQPALTNWQAFMPGARFNEFAFTEGLTWRQAMLQLYPEGAIATPTPFSSPTATPTNTPWPTATPWWWRWTTPTATPPPSETPAPTATP